MMPTRVNFQPVFLLASKAWRENSLRIEVFSRDYGRLSLIARSARTRGSELRGVLVPFVPISASWYGKEELKTLHRAEWLGGWAQPKNQSLFSALYLNELMLKLTALEDPHPELYQQFAQTQQIIASSSEHSIALRHFEWMLLKSSGLSPDIQQDSDKQVIEAKQFYFIQPEHNPQQVDEYYQHPSGVTVSGSLLQEIDTQTLTSSSNQNQARALTRLLINHYLPSGTSSRQVLQQLNEMKKNSEKKIRDKMTIWR